MKKSFSTLLLTVAVSFMMTACLEEETSAIDVTGTATIKGTVLLDNDETSDSDGLERANEAVVRITYDAAELDINGDGDSRLVTLETTTDAQGVYSLEVPSSPSTVDFFVKVDDYETTYSYFDSGEGEDVTFDAVYQDDGSSVNNIQIGETRVHDVILTGKYLYD